jgi:hypothetical protein
MTTDDPHAFFAALNCPTRITWTGQIKNRFTPLDIDHMNRVHPPIDLSDYASVKIWAHVIYNRVSSGSMPPPNSGEQRWPQQWVDDFGCWIQQGCPES